MSKEYIKNVFQKFDDHLNIENNNRIIFSGKFGIGKSYFLNEFFKDENQNEKYFPIFLNPVNYSIASNEDIFELIKFDILYQILDKEILDFENFDFPKGNLLYQYFSNKFFNDFVSTVDSIGENIIDEVSGKSYTLLKNLGKLISKIQDIGKKDFDKFKKEIEANSDLNVIIDFFNKEEVKFGSIYENNAITQLIFHFVKNVEEKTKKKTVLVIDDLDRIDPEHIFRILNIFSVHDNLGENKFGFEKIVLVCDIKNIESIYHHFYGENVDFYGYINKFYSLDIYEYSNRDYVKWFDKNFTIDSYRNGNIEFLGYIFSDAIFKNVISARQLFNNDFSRQGVTTLYNKYNEQNFNVLLNNKYVSIFSLFQSSYVLIKTIFRYFGNSNNFLKYVDKIENNQLSKFQNIIGELYLFIDFKREKNHDQENIILTTPYGFNIKLNYGRYEITGDFNNADLKTFFKDILMQYQKIIEI
ncbi:P-loop NTPase fold protein [Kaistella chaponensis]|nr:P-loop NTPase fold protein [Kaistella chaponensis]